MRWAGKSLKLSIFRTGTSSSSADPWRKLRLFFSGRILKEKAFCLESKKKYFVKLYINIEWKHE